MNDNVFLILALIIIIVIFVPALVAVAVVVVVIISIFFLLHLIGVVDNDIVLAVVLVHVPCWYGCY